MRISNLFIKEDENEKFIIDYSYADVLLRIFSIFWIGYIIFVFHENLNRPASLFEPIIWLQKLFISSIPSLYLFYSIIIISLFLCIYTIFNKKIVYRGILFLLLLWLNTLKWNYNFFSHVGHLFLLAHFFTIFIPSKNINSLNSKNDIRLFSNSIRWAYAGVLITYTMAGFWKFLSLFHKLIYQSKLINWMSEDAVELNAIVSSRIWDESVSISMLKIYEIPFIWQAATLFIFCIQLIAVLGAFNKKLSYIVLAGLLIFHLYNILFINTFFYVSSIVLLILLLPYHLVNRKRLT